MQVLRLGEQVNVPLCVALGYFDAVHIGHKKIISSVVSYAKQNEYRSAVFTFDNNFFEVLGRDVQLINSLEERLQIFENLGLDYVILEHFNESFMNMQPVDFLNTLNSQNVKMIACGKDYNFGARGSGTPKLLEDYFLPKGVKIYIANDVTVNGVKVSSTLIRQLISEGNLQEAQKYIGDKND